MNRAPLDVATISLGLAGIGFAVVVFLANLISEPAIQPILALILAAAGTIGLLLSRGRRQRKNRKELS